MTTRTITLSDLPTRYREIAEIIGLAQALELISHCGGRTIYVPRRAHLSRSSLHAASPELAALLSLHFGGDRVAVPALTALKRKSRSRQIQNDRAKGAPVSWIAEKYALSERQVYRHLLID